MAKAKTKRKKKNAKEESATASGARPEYELDPVRLNCIDPTPAEMVRAGYNREALERYEEAYKAAGELPPVDIFRGPSKFYLGDGAHRFRARTAVQDDIPGFSGYIPARVRLFHTDEEAYSAAVAFAVGANEEHGLYRTPEDKRRAIAAVIDRAGYQTASDREIGELCKVGHNLVRKVRETLSGDGSIAADSPAHASTRDYKPEPTAKPADEPREGSVLNDPPEEDEVGELVAGLKSDEYHAARFKDCPLLKPDGTHQQRGRCHVCGNKGWLTHEEWDALSDDLKEVARKREGEQVRVEIKPATDSQLAGARKASEEAQALCRKLAAIATDFLNSAHGEVLREAADDHGAPFECDEEAGGGIPGSAEVEVVRTWRWPALNALAAAFGTLSGRLYSE